jgi:cystathionine gamma-synthase
MRETPVLDPLETTNRHFTTGQSTRSVHAGERGRQTCDTLTTPIHQTSTYWFKNSSELAAYQEGRIPRYEYGRYGNPTWQAVERKLAEMEGAEEAVLFASGMSAATTAFFALLPKGGHLIITSDCYRRTRQFCAEYLTKMDVETTVIEPSNLDELRRSLRDDTDIFFSEAPTNPYLRVLDVPKAVDLARSRGATVIIDSTFATPINYRPLEDGADLVIHSATKYMGGHNDLLAGAAVGPTELIQKLRDAVGVLGGIIAPQNAYLLLRGMKTLGLRMARHNDNALRVARVLETHPKVRRAYYPGLESHPDHEVAGRLLRGFGGVVTFEIDGDLDDTASFVDHCRIPYIAPSLGGVESLIEMPAVMSYWDVPRQERLGYGISDSLVRLSCGIEDPEDLITDLQQALEAV